MPRTEARIFTSIWKDPVFLALDPGAQRLYMFLLSQDDLAYSGLMPLRPSRWASKAAGLTTADVERDLKTLEASGRMFVITDEASGELLVRSLLRHDRAWKQPNLLKQAIESADQIESPRIRSALLAELRRLPLDESPSDQVKTLVGNFIQDLERGCPYPAAYPPGDPNPESTDNPSGNPAADPTDEDYARARGLGERNVAVPGSPGPLFPSAPNSLAAPRDRKQGHRLPDDFALTGDMREWAAKNTPHVNQDREFERFCDYWRAKPGRDGRKLDWRLTWNNWMRTAEDRQGPRDRGSPSVPFSAADQRRAEVAQLRELDRQQREGHPPNVIPGSVIT